MIGDRVPAFSGVLERMPDSWWQRYADAEPGAIVELAHVREEEREIDMLGAQGRWLDGIAQLRMEPR